jgi:hypothetical protein
MDMRQALNYMALPPPQRPAYPSEDAFFSQSGVPGYAAPDNSVVLSSNPAPGVNMDAVRQNETYRTLMRQGVLPQPSFPITEGQRSAFDGYGSEDDIRATIAARIATGDPSVLGATEEQQNFTRENLGTPGNGNFGMLVGSPPQDMRQALSMDDRMRQFGMDPDAKRNMLLPLPTDARTEADPRKWDMSDWTAPEWLYEGARALNLPGHVARGGDYEAKDVTDMGLALMGMGTTGAAMGGVPRGALGMNVFQGGPHKYGPEGAAKSLEHIGKGEGAQAYGWGRYDAGAEDVAAKYRKDLSNDVFVEKDGRVFDPSTLEHLNLKAGLRKHNGDINALIADPKIQNIIKENGVPDVLSGRYSQTEYQQMFSRDMAVLSDLQSRGGLTKGEGYLYKHDLPDEDIARYMDWDKPLSEQPENVRAALEKYGIDLELDAERTGEQTYNSIMHKMDRDAAGGVIGRHSPGSKQAASEALGKAGIPGLKYLDGMSRGADEGTRNYVTWDQDVLDRMKMLERNGEDMRQALMYGQGGL